MASIKCGNCKATHGSAAEVKLCYFPPVATQPVDWGKENLRSPYETKGVAYSTTRWAKDAMPRSTGAVATIERQKPAGRVPEGRYAIKGADGAVKFYRVTHGKENGKWAGYTFVEAQASDDHWPIRNRTAREAILRAIGADVAGAMALYGTEIGKCGHCGRKLTSEWRKKGIGPVCAQKMGWAS